MRRIVAASLAAVVAALAAGSSTAAAAADSGLRLVDSAGRFPERAYVLALPPRLPLDRSRVKVTESGNRVSNLTVVPASAADPGDFGVVLLLDASLTMRGKPIADAMDAARAFASRRPPNQKLAIVSFNSETRLLLPFTSNDRQIENALSQTPQTRYGTVVYDAIGYALDLLKESGAKVGTIVLLSDGQNVGSRSTVEDSMRRLKEDNVRLFSVGLRTPAYYGPPLRRMAEISNGSYSEVSNSSSITRIYDALGLKLANEYLVRYRSLAGPSEPVRVKIHIEGVKGAAVSRYVTPALPVVAEPPFQRSFGERFWKSPVVMILVTLLSAALVGLGLVTLLRPRPRTLRRRMSSFVSLKAGDERQGPVAGRLLASAEKSLEATKWWSRFKEKLELAEVRIPALHIALWTAAGTLFAIWLLATISGSKLFALPALAIPAVVNGAINRKINRRRTLFAEQLPENLQVLAAALRAGHSLIGALSVVANESQEPSRSEFQRVVADEQLGVPLEDAFEIVVKRMDNRDLEQVALVAALQRQRGANAAEVLDRVTETVRARFELRRMVKTLTAQGRMARWIVSALPVVLLVTISALNPTYISPLFETTTGRVLLVVSGVMVVAGSLVIKRIVNVKV